MRKVTLKGLLAHKLRLALTALAIVLGVTFISGTFVLTDTLHNTFTTLFGNIYSNVDFQVRGVAQLGSGGGRDPQRAPRVAAGHGPPACPASRPPTARSPATPSSSPPTARPSRPAAARPPSGVSFDPNPQISALHLIAGGPPVTPDDVVMDAGTAQKYHFTVGQQVRILSAGPAADLHHHRHRPVRHGQQPGRGHPGRLRRCRPRRPSPRKPARSTTSTS